MLLHLPEITLFIAEGGGTNPDFNSQLRRALERANASDVPKTTVMNTLKKVVCTLHFDTGVQSFAL